MKTSHILPMAVAGVVLGGALPAGAADLWVPPAVSVVEPVPVEFGSNWYLRGDVGYRFNAEPSADYVSGICAACNGDLVDEEFDDSWMVGVGAGYKFSPWLRADVTVDYMAQAGFRGSFLSPVEDHRADISTWTFLANGYVDMGTWNRITPYVGAGIGTAYNNVETYTVNGVGGYFADQGEWDLAWALMAGVAFDLTPNLSIDVGYRYLSMGEVALNDTVGNGDRLTIDDLKSHEARVGVRYMLD